MECANAIRPHIGSEVFLLSCEVIKYNKFGWRNERTLVLTHESLIILKNRRRQNTFEMRLKASIAKLKGISISLHENSTEMVCHSDPQRPDLRLSLFSVTQRRQIIDTIKLFYSAATRENICVFAVRQKKLAMYTTQESDIKKGISKMPLPLARINSEDIVN